MKISIITVCYNSEKTIEDTIQSVLNQTYKDFEYLIIDGLSKDNTLNIINKYQDPRIKLISEKDKGLYDAMNKGIKMANGDIVGIINSDDVLADEKVFERINDNYQKNSEILYGNVLYMDENLEKIIRRYISKEKDSDAWCPAHPSMYIRKDVFNKIGLYDISYKIAADYDFMVRCNKNNIKWQYLNEYLVKMRYGGASNGVKGYLNNFKECIKVLKKNKVSLPYLKTIKRSINTILQLLKS